MSKEKKRSFSVHDVVYNSILGVCDVIAVIYTNKGKRRLAVKSVSGITYTEKASKFQKCGEVFVQECPYLFGEHIIHFEYSHSTCNQVQSEIRITDTIGYNMQHNKHQYHWVLEGTVLNEGDFEQLLREGRIVPVGAKHISDILTRTSKVTIN